MTTIAISSQKGGSGKTTLTAHLAVEAGLSQVGPVVVIDTDPQQTLATWWNVRKAETPQFAPVSLRELPAKLTALGNLGFTHCLIDTPPALTDQSREVLKLSDLVIIPTRPSPNDLWSLGATLDLVRESGTPFAFVITQAKANARITTQTIAALSRYGEVLETIIHDRVDYAASMTDGRTAGELNPKSPAATELAQLWGNTRDRLGRLANISELAKQKQGVQFHV